MYKLSHYNSYIPISAEKSLIYNSFNNSLFEIDTPLSSILKEMQLMNTFDFSRITDHDKSILLKEGYIVDRSKNEQEIVCQTKQRFLKNVRKNSRSIGLTLLITNSCNLNCAYCFEGKEKPKTKMDESVLGKILEFITFKKAESSISRLSLSWYGGEPLMYPNMVQNYAKKIKDLCNNLDIKLTSSIVTNGVNLNKKNLEILQEAGVENIQITIDGDKETHDRRRPFVHSNKSSFDLILNNLEEIAGIIPISIRINVDKEVYPGIQELFKKLINRKIWPHKKNVKLYLGFTCATKEFDDNKLFTAEEFSFAVSEFRKMKIKIYNEWAKENNLPFARFKFKYPVVTNNYCMSYSGLNSFVIDANGNISKCWEHINNPDVVIGNVSQGITNATRSDKFKKIEENCLIPQNCVACKSLPICEAKFCPNDDFKLKPNRCSFWKYQIEECLREQYLMQKERPELIESYEAVDEMYNSGNFMGFEM